jgi:hypothetical protein
MARASEASTKPWQHRDVVQQGLGERKYEKYEKIKYSQWFQKGPRSCRKQK